MPCIPLLRISQSSLHERVLLNINKALPYTAYGDTVVYNFGGAHIFAIRSWVCLYSAYFFLHATVSPYALRLLALKLRLYGLKAVACTGKYARGAA